MSRWRIKRVFWSGERGLSLIEVLVGVSVLGVVIVAMAGIFGNAMIQMREVTRLTEVDELRQFILTGANCTSSFTPPNGGTKACAVAGLSNLRDAAGNEIIATPFSTFGKGYRLRAQCSDPDSTGPRSRELMVEYLKVTASGTPVTNPKTGAVTTWQPLFDEDLSICSVRMSPEWQTTYADLEYSLEDIVLYVIWLANVASSGITTSPVNLAPDSAAYGPLPAVWLSDVSAYSYGMARCPRGYTVVSGGVDCSLSANGAMNIDPFAPESGWGHPLLGNVRGSGYKTFNSPRRDEPNAWEAFWLLPSSERGFRGVDYWYGGCSQEWNWIGQPNREGRVYAQCKRNANL